MVVCPDMFDAQSLVPSCFGIDRRAGRNANRKLGRMEFIVRFGNNWRGGERLSMKERRVFGWAGYYYVLFLNRQSNNR